MPPEPVLDLARPPDLVQVLDADGRLLPGASVAVTVPGASVGFTLHSEEPVARLRIRWRADLRGLGRVLGDAWERAYGDLGWAAVAPDRMLPWTFVALTASGRALGAGVAVRPAAFCGWTLDDGGVTLWADVRSGGRPVELSGRELRVCEVVTVAGDAGESAFAVQRRLAALMSPAPRLPDHPVYGTNDWHFAYGRTSADVIAASSAFVADCAPADAVAAGNLPYSVVDDGWSQGGLGHGPWRGNAAFGDMSALAARLGDLGVRPGIWYRPLTPLPDTPPAWLLPHAGVLDPTIPEVGAVVAEHVERLVGWGYRMIKHDFTTWDVLRRWGPAMGADLTDGGWSFADRGRTTAEVLTGLYDVVRRAGDGAAARRGDPPPLVIGCNTVGHLAAGSVDLQRVGDDTDGRGWERTRRMGVNALAFRAAQHGTFFAVDPDVAPITADLPAAGALQWLDLVARSGTATFVAVDPASRTPRVAAAVRDAFALAAAPRPADHPAAEPLDWFDRATPARWRTADGVVEYDWSGPDGADPFGP